MPDQNDSQLNGSWARDSIISVDHNTAFRYDGAGFRLDDDGPYLRVHFVTIYVSDQERSMRFFVDQLGFSLVSDVRFASGNRWVEVGSPDGTAVLALAKPIPGLNEEHFIGNSGMVTFLTEDVEGKYREWSARAFHSRLHRKHQVGEAHSADLSTQTATASLWPDLTTPPANSINPAVPMPKSSNPSGGLRRSLKSPSRSRCVCFPSPSLRLPASTMPHTSD